MCALVLCALGLRGVSSGLMGLSCVLAVPTLPLRQSVNDPALLCQHTILVHVKGLSVQRRNCGEREDVNLKHFVVWRFLF